MAFAPIDQMELQETIDMVKGIYQQGPAALSPEITKDFTTSLGLIPYNLVAGAKLLAPVITPIRNRTPRRPGRGKATEFKAITSYNATNANSWAAEGLSGNVVTPATVDVLMPYKIQSQKANVTFEAQYYGQGQVDAKAQQVAALLRSFMIQEEANFLFGNPATAITGASAGGSGVSIGGNIGNSAAPVAGTPAGGGTIPAGTLQVFQTALTGPGQESLANASAVTATPTANQYVPYTPTAVAHAIGYKLYWKLSTDTTYNVTATNGKTVNLGQTGVAPYTANPGNTLPGADGSGNSLAYPGLVQQLLASGSGATVTSKNGTLTMGTGTTFGDIDNLYLSIWNSGAGDPDLLVVNAFESLTITGGTLGAGTPYYIQPADQQDGFVAGYKASRFVNKVTGRLVDIITHQTLPQGIILALSTQMPPWYPGSDIPSVFDFEAVYDYLEIDYPPTQPAWPVEVRNAGALLMWLPLVNGVLLGISQS